MTLEALEARINATVSLASSHANACKTLSEAGNLKGAIEYCGQAGHDLAYIFETRSNLS